MLLRDEEPGDPRQGAAWPGPSSGSCRTTRTAATSASGRRDGRRLATPMLLVLVIVEVTDLVFAVDSIPAVLAVTRDPFLVYTSNIFAILGLRSLYFLLARMVDRFHLLQDRAWPSSSPSWA